MIDFDTTKYIKITDDAKTKTSELIAQMKAKFPVWSYWDDKELDNLFPSPKEPTTRHFHREVESRDKGKSRNSMEGKPLITLREYALAQMQYYDETGKFLDKDGFTLLQDLLPVGWVAGGGYDPDGRGVLFDRDDAGDERGSYGFREAISLPSSLPSLPSDLEERVRMLEEWKSRVEKVIEI